MTERQLTINEENQIIQYFKQGLSFSQVCKKLGKPLNLQAEKINKLYEKYGVTNRIQLLNKLKTERIEK